MIKRRGKMRRFTALMLSAAFVFSQCFPALAAGTDSVAAALTEVSVQTDQTLDTAVQVEEEVSAQDELSAQETSAQEETPAQEELPAQEEAPAQEETPAQDELPAQEETPAQVETPPQEETTAQEETSVQEETPAQEETPVQEETPAQEETSGQKETSVQEAAPPQEELLEQEITEAPEKETLQEETAESERESGSEEESESEAESESEQESETEESAEYILHLTHYFRFTVNGESQNVRIEEIRTLTPADFQDGICDISRFACVDERLTVTEAKPVSLEDFGESCEGGARIVYAVADGWKLEPVDGIAEDGASLRTSFEGTGVLGDYIFVPANVVCLNMKYQYSNTGGLAGIDAAPPEILEVLPEKKGDRYEVEIALPVIEGFRIVLDPAPLNHYLVKAPTGNETPEELHQMWQDGSFSGDISKYCIYAYQQKNGLDAKPDYSIQNATYSNRYSDEYNQAWNEARSLTMADCTIEAVSRPGQADGSEQTGEQEQTEKKYGANALINPHLKVTLTEEQLINAMQNGLSITVSYRRNATWYTVRHWVPKAFAMSESGQPAGEVVNVNGIEYVLQDQEQMQGRVGGLTRAAAKIGDKYDLLVSIGFAQKLIENEKTVVDIYYKAAESYRVIFDTDDTYIPRQQVKIGESVDFTKVQDPAKKGYRFAGWKYLNNDAVPDENGEYGEDAYSRVDKNGNEYILQLTEDLIASKARVEEVDGVLMLHLYPIWEPDKTHITVVLWTEDLTRKDDVQAKAEGGDPAYYYGKYAEYNEVTTHHFNDPKDPGASYSNMGSFTMEVDTESSLVSAVSSGTLQDKVQEKVQEELKKSCRKI